VVDGDLAMFRKFGNGSQLLDVTIFVILLVIGKKRRKENDMNELYSVIRKHIRAHMGHSHGCILPYTASRKDIANAIGVRYRTVSTAITEMLKNKRPIMSEVRVSRSKCQYSLSPSSV